MPVLTEQEMFFTQYEPKMSNRFVLEMDGIPAYLVRKIERPKYEAENKELFHINLVRNIKGRSKWGEVSCELYDAIVPSAAQAVMEWVRLSHESVTGRDGYADFYKKNITFKMLGPVGDVVEQWIGNGAYIRTATFSEGNWTSNEPAFITLGIQADYWLLSY